MKPWVWLNRLRSGAGRYEAILKQWGITDFDLYLCVGPWSVRPNSDPRTCHDWSQCDRSSLSTHRTWQPPGQLVTYHTNCQVWFGVVNIRNNNRSNLHQDLIVFLVGFILVYFDYQNIWRKYIYASNWQRFSWYSLRVLRISTVRTIFFTPKNLHA